MPLPIDHAGRHIEQRIHIRLLLAQVVEVSGIHIIIVMDQSPPERIGANTVHPTRQRRLVAGLVERLFHHLVVAENRQHRTELRMCIAHPNEPVALDPVPQVVLHIEVYGISSRHPNAVEARIARAERAQVRNIPVGKFSANLLYGHHHIVYQQVDPHETESRIAGFAHTVPRQVHHIVAHRMVVRRTAFGRDLAHRLAGRLAQPDAHSGRLVPRNACCHDLNATLYLPSEIEQQRRAPALAARHHAVRIRRIDHLPLALGEQMVRSLDQLFVLNPHDPDRRKISRRPQIGLGFFDRLRRKNGGQGRTHGHSK